MDLDDFLAPSGNTFNYKQGLNEGDAIQGILQAKPEVSPHIDFKTKKQAETANGKPKWQLKVTLDVEGENKTLWLQDGAYWAAVLAFREAKSAAEDANTAFEYRGGVFGMKRLADEPSKTAGFAPKKNYAVKFVPGS